MGYQASDEELIFVANNFLLNSPPGEFLEVVTDVRNLLHNEELLNRTASKTFRTYNTQQLTQVQSPSYGHDVLITKYGEVTHSEYIDPRGQQVLFYDHIKQEVSGSRALKEGELDPDVEPYRAAFDEEADKYACEHYPEGASTVYGKKRGSEYQIIVVISASKYSPNNYWNGRWRSTWQIAFSPNAAEATITGVVQVNVHYYEQGNVQLNNTFEKRLTSTVGDAATTATQAVKAIIAAEHTFHVALDTSYEAMGDTTFKSLRRILPVTVQKIDWSKLQALKLGSEIKRSDSHSLA